MKQTLSQAFKSINEQNLPAHLEGAILLGIKAIREKQAKKRLFLSYAGMMSSFLLLFYAIAEFGSAFLQSEFWSVASLAFSDILVIAGNWKDFVYSLLETFPVINAIAIFTPFFILFLSFGAYLSSRKNNYGNAFYKLSIV
jgi:hypothetical protein